MELEETLSARVLETWPGDVESVRKNNSDISDLVKSAAFFLFAGTPWIYSVTRVSGVTMTTERDPK